MRTNLHSLLQVSEILFIRVVVSLTFLIKTFTAGTDEPIFREGMKTHVENGLEDTGTGEGGNIAKVALTYIHHYV